MKSDAFEGSETLDALDLAVNSDVTVCHGCLELRRDLMEARAAAEAAAEAKSVFLGNVSHEIRTPLNGMLVSAQLLLRSQLSSEQKELVESITESGTALLSVLGDVLDFSCLGRGNVEIQRHPMRLREIIEGAFDASGIEAASKKVCLSYSMDAELARRMIAGDPLRLRQILSALISNAVKFNVAGGDVEVFASAETKQGTIELKEASGHSRADAGNEDERHQTRNVLQILVRDNGVGMDKEYVNSRLFESFSRGYDALNRPHEGLGLGLAIADKLANLMGGEIRVESEMSKGSTFTLTVPLVWAEETMNEAPSSILRSFISEEEHKEVHENASSASLRSGPITPTGLYERRQMAQSITSASDYLADSSGMSSDISRSAMEEKANKGSVTALSSGAIASVTERGKLHGRRPGCLSNISELSYPSRCHYSFPSNNTEHASCTVASISSFFQAGDRTQSLFADVMKESHTTRGRNAGPNDIFINEEVERSDTWSHQSSSVAPEVEQRARNILKDTSSHGIDNVKVFVDISHEHMAAQIKESCIVSGLTVVSKSEGNQSVVAADVCITMACNALEAIRTGWRSRPVVAIGLREDVPRVALPSVVLISTPVKHIRLMEAIAAALGPRRLSDIQLGIDDPLNEKNSTIVPGRHSVDNASLVRRSAWEQPSHGFKVSSRATLSQDGARFVVPRSAGHSNDHSGLMRKNPTILVAEDNAVNQRVIHHVLRSAAPFSRIDIVSDGLEVLEAAQKLTYDLILMDAHMPRLDGLEATRRLKEMMPAEKFPTVVALSADSTEDLPKRCREVGMVDFLSKPFKLEDVERVVSLAYTKTADSHRCP